MAGHANANTTETSTSTNTSTSITSSTSTSAPQGVAADGTSSSSGASAEDALNARDKAINQRNAEVNAARLAHMKGTSYPLLVLDTPDR